MAHTPGPWQYDTQGLVFSSQGRITRAFFRGGYQEIEDARLIAAAPDLLDACQEIMAAHTSWKEALAAEDEEAAMQAAVIAYHKLEHAVAKATEESTT